MWLLGARGNVAVTVAAGLAALRAQKVASVGLCTESGPLRDCKFTDFDDICLGGHEIRTGEVLEVFDRLAESDRIMNPAWRADVAADLHHYQRAIVLGAERGGELARLVGDLQAFREEHNISHLVVVNLASTEGSSGELPTSEAALLQAAAADQLPMSTIYALAAMQAGAAYVNFTPSTGATGEVFDALARQHGCVHAGRDGKTGETLLKAALLPMFAARNLRVQSWFGQNILGNGDGRTLRDPASKSAKQSTKAGLVEAVLGYQPDCHVGIDYVEPLGDWKLAWDHVLFQGFLGTQMSLQLTWQGADSILAAPLVIDLARICALAMERGDTGLLSSLGFFFKEPLGSQVHGLAEQYEQLVGFVMPDRA